jgi:hypothetical protein
MKKAVAMKWIRALRSGKYRKGTGALKKKTGGYCCLGLLCEITKKENGGKWTKDTGGYFTFLDRSGIEKSDFLPASVRRLAGMKTNTGALTLNKIRTTLAELNDGDSAITKKPYTFKQIADVIAKNWRKL